MHENVLHSHAAWIHKTLEMGQNALPLDVPVGALILHGGQIVGTGFNTRERDQNPLGHAELTALSMAAQTLKRWRLNGCTLYVNLEPCPMCAEAIRQSRISQVVFGAKDVLNGACGSRYHLLQNSSDIEVIGGIQESRCRKELAEFFKRLRD